MLINGRKVYLMVHLANRNELLTGPRGRAHIADMRLILSFAVWLVLVAPVCAQVPDDGGRQQAVRIATDWLQKNTAYKHIPELRTWVPLSNEQMAAQAKRGGVLGDATQASAIYVCGKDMMYIREGVNFRDVAVLSLLVHELTHHAQCLNRVPMTDLCKIEREAYVNQQRFVRGLPERLAQAKQPMPPAQVKELNDFAAGIDGIVDTVCEAARTR